MYTHAHYQALIVQMMTLCMMNALGNLHAAAENHRNSSSHVLVPNPPRALIDMMYY